MGNNVILLVEDNPDDEELTLLAFKHCNVANEVIVVHDGVEALEYLFNTSDSAADPETQVMPQVVLLDINLPKVNGLEVLKRIRADKRTRLIPVVMMTSSSEEEDILKSYLHGANSYVRKPIDFQSFIEAVQQLGLYWLLLNQAPPKY